MPEVPQSGRLSQGPGRSPWRPSLPWAPHLAFSSQWVLEFVGAATSLRCSGFLRLGSKQPALVYFPVPVTWPPGLGVREMAASSRGAARRSLEPVCARTGQEEAGRGGGAPRTGLLPRNCQLRWGAGDGSQETQGPKCPAGVRSQPPTQPPTQQAGAGPQSPGSRQSQSKAISAVTATYRGTTRGSTWQSKGWAGRLPGGGGI